jgi:predicted transcriptional regulator
LKNGKPLSLEEIKELIGSDFKNASQACNRLERWGYVKSYYEVAQLKDGTHRKIKKIKISF